MAARPSWDPYRPVRSEKPGHDVLWSILAHALVLGLVYYVAQMRPASDAVRQRVEATRNAAFQAAAAQRLNELASAESALAQRSHGPTPPPLAPVKSAQEALEQARTRYDAMREEQHRARATELANRLRIPLDEALKQTRADLPALPQAPHTEAEALAQLAQLQTQAAAAAREAQAAASGGASPGGAPAKGGQGGSRVLGGSGATDLSPFEVEADAAQGPQNVPRGRFSSIPPLDAPVRAAGGRSLGAGGTYANRVYIDTWYVVGPFEAISDQPLEHPELPEVAIDLDGTYAGKSGRTLRWRYVQASEYPMFLPDAAESAIYYGYTELRLDHDMDVWAWIGADDDAKVWVDDRLVWKGGAPVKPWFLRDARSMKREIADYNLSEGKVRLRLSAGRHRVLFKLYNGADVMFFSLVLTGGDGRGTAPTAQP